MQETYRNMNEQITPATELQEKVMEQAAPRRKVRIGALATAAILVIVLAAIPLAAYADQWIPIVEDFIAIVLKEETVDGVLKYQEGIDAEGNPWSAGELQMEKTPDWLKVEDERVYFIANGENIDITDEISLDEPFVYQYTDKKNITYYMAVGRHRDGLGWLMRRRNGFEAEGKYAGWIYNGDYGHGYWDTETQTPCGWYMRAYEELGIPWMNHLKEYYDYDPDQME